MAKDAIISKATLMPIGLVLIVGAATWAMATDRQERIGRINGNTETIVEHTSELAVLKKAAQDTRDSLMRIEIKMDTLPAEGTP